MGHDIKITYDISNGETGQFDQRRARLHLRIGRPSAAPYVGADLTIHPNGVGSSATSELGPVSFTPRLFNGGFYYDVCSVSGAAASGYYGAGCPGTLGAVAGINVLSPPTLGAPTRLTSPTSRLPALRS
ncbi:MAG: hypothetical protein ACI91B_002855 [Planctomycetota bacterium]|jgi:hypothetical protein